MNYLLDTNLLSETRKRRRDPGVTEWIAATPRDRLRLSAMTIGEVARGINRLTRRGDQVQATALQSWLDEVVAEFGNRITAVTTEVALQWAAADVSRPVPVVDGLIAATAQVHGWTLVTRNVKDFEGTGVRLLNPFTG